MIGSLLVKKPSKLYDLSCQEQVADSLNLTLFL